MPEVVLIYERSCPNVREARSNLMQAFSRCKLPASWREIDVAAPDTPEKWRAFGSPTVLVDGIDVGDGQPVEGAACRLYAQGGRAPSVDLIAKKLRAARTSGSGKATAIATLPGMAIALLPKVVCPACWPAYAAALGALGLGFLMQERYLLPLSIGVLGLATAAIAFRARARRGYGPALLAGLAGASLLVAKFGVDSPVATYLGAGAFAAAAVWNLWPVRRAGACPACQPTNTNP